MSLHIRQSKRSILQQLITDPLGGLGVLIIFLTFKILPLGVARKLGAGLGFICYKLLSSRNHVARVNLNIAYPDKSPEFKEDILKNMWRHWGMFFSEIPHTNKLFNQASVNGLDVVLKTAKDKKPFFLCSAHLGNWELASSGPLFDKHALNPVYRPANNPWIDKLLFQRRSGELIPKGALGARKMLAVLKRGEGVVILCDQKLNEGVDAPLFGKMAKTPSAVANLSLKFNASIYMGKSIRQKNGIFRIDVEQIDVNAFKNESDPVLAITTKMNQTIEQWIYENPEQWLWIHHRFDKSIYKKG